MAVSKRASGIFIEREFVWSAKLLFLCMCQSPSESFNSRGVWLHCMYLSWVLFCVDTGY